MSNDPKKGQSPGAAGKGAAAPVQSLEDAVYSPHLATGHDDINRGNPLITIPITILMYGTFIGTGVWLGAQTKVGKQALKTVGVDLLEKAEDAVPPPPPPPPPPAPVAAPVVVKKDLEVKEPPPPPDPNKDMVPDVVPKELPQEDRSAAYAVGGTTATAVSGVVGATSGTQSVMGTGSSSRVVEFDFTQIKEKLRPPPPPYPPMAKIAKIQGTVIVEIVIGPDGVPVSARALDGPPQLRPTAENYAMQWRFEPALMNGQPVNAKFKLTMPFRLR
jgi:protein TonB